MLALDQQGFYYKQQQWHEEGYPGVCLRKHLHATRFAIPVSSRASVSLESMQTRVGLGSSPACAFLFQHLYARRPGYRKSSAPGANQRHIGVDLDSSPGYAFLAQEDQD